MTNHTSYSGHIRLLLGENNQHNETIIFVVVIASAGAFFRMNTNINCEHLYLSNDLFAFVCERLPCTSAGQLSRFLMSFSPKVSRTALSPLRQNKEGVQVMHSDFRIHFRRCSLPLECTSLKGPPLECIEQIPAPLHVGFSTSVWTHCQSGTNTCGFCQVCRRRSILAIT